MVVPDSVTRRTHDGSEDSLASTNLCCHAPGSMSDYYRKLTRKESSWPKTGKD